MARIPQRKRSLQSLFAFIIGFGLNNFLNGIYRVRYDYFSQNDGIINDGINQGSDTIPNPSTLETVTTTSTATLEAFKKKIENQAIIIRNENNLSISSLSPFASSSDKDDFCSLLGTPTPSTISV